MDKILFFGLLFFQGIMAQQSDSIILFEEIDNAPIFIGCEKVFEQDAKKCFVDKINKHVLKHQRYPVSALENMEQGEVLTYLLVDVYGNFVVEKVETPYESLKKEAIRVIDLLPIVSPGSHQQQLVNTRYLLKMKFVLN